MNFALPLLFFGLSEGPLMGQRGISEYEFIVCVMPGHDFESYKLCQKKTGRKYTEQDYQIIAKSETLLSSVLFQHWLNTPNSNVSIRRNPAAPTLYHKSLEQRGVSSLFSDFHIDSVAFSCVPNPQQSQDCPCRTRCLSRMVSLGALSLPVGSCHLLPPLPTCSTAPVQGCCPSPRAATAHRALPGAQRTGHGLHCETPRSEHVGCFCAAHLTCKDDAFLVENRATDTQGVLYFFRAVLGIYKWSFQVKCQNELHLCNPRSSKGIQKINLGIFSTGLLLGSSRTDPETLVCSGCLGLIFLFWARLLGTSV